MTLPDLVRRTAEVQAGVLTREQLRRSGLAENTIDRLVLDWQRLLPGVYLLAPPFIEASLTARVWAGVLAGGDRSRAAGPTAALLQGLAEESDFRPRGAQSSVPVEILTPRRLMPASGFVFLREHDGRRLASVRLPPRTRIEDTVFDLCARADSVDEVVAWVSRACQRGLVGPEQLRRHLAVRPRFRNRPLIAPVLGDVRAGATTLLENRALHDVFRAHGLPEPQLQARTGAGAVADGLYRDYGLVVEFDGRLGHVAEGAFRDMARDNRNTLQGVSTLRYGWRDVLGDSCGVAAQIAAVLTARGWHEGLMLCENCLK